jgi:hypothetical protein
MFTPDGTAVDEQWFTTERGARQSVLARLCG